MVASEDGRRKQAFSPTLAGVLMEGACAARQGWMWRLGLAHRPLCLAGLGWGWAGLAWPGLACKSQRHVRIRGATRRRGNKPASQQARPGRGRMLASPPHSSARRHLPFDLLANSKLVKTLQSFYLSLRLAIISRSKPRMSQQPSAAAPPTPFGSLVPQDGIAHSLGLQLK